jgi:hypothetical protein
MIVPDGTAWNLSGTGGQLSQTGWQPLRIETCKLRYQHPRLFVAGAELKSGDEGSVRPSGEIEFAGDRPLKLRAEFDRIAVTPLLAPDWRGRLRGNLHGTAHIAGSLDRLESIAVQGTLRLVEGRIEALPVLDRIAIFTRTERYRQLAFQKASADFSWQQRKLVVSRLVVESTGLLRVEGSCVVDNGTMDGQFQVGVTPSTLRWLPGSQGKVFTAERDGYLWTHVRVEGPADHPKEDLSPRLIAAAGAEVVEDLKSTVEKSVEGAMGLFYQLLP